MLSSVMLNPRRDRARLAIIAHDGKKADLVAFATFNRDRLAEYELVATGAPPAICFGTRSASRSNVSLRARTAATCRLPAAWSRARWTR
jgi:hypothetical protein